MSRYINSYKLSVLLLVITLAISSPALCQEESSEVCTQGNKYLSIRIKSLNKYDQRVERQQRNLLKKLSRKENRLAHKLEKTDSAGFLKRISVSQFHLTPSAGWLSMIPLLTG